MAGFAAQGLNEHITMTAAADLGLHVARTRYLEFDGQSAIVADRYDRITRNGGTTRIHQEDLCQATATPPTRKYETDGGPGAAAISDVLRLHADEASNWRFVEAVAFNYLVGASDGHAKNLSVLLSGNQVRLAPLYDLASSLPYDPVADDSDLRKVAIAIGGQRRYGHVTRANWERLARRTGIEADHLLQRIDVLVRDLQDALASAFSSVPPGPETATLRRRYLDQLGSHLDRVSTQLTARRRR